jgi:arthrofactin-type cyclic lipopeptide synthetase C
MQPRGLDGAHVPHATVTAAAREYIHHTSQKYPHGPVHLIGHSFGGWVAFEMAQQLRASGRGVSSLTILDSGVPDDDGREYSRSEAMLELVTLYEQAAQRSLNIHPDQIDALHPAAQLNLLVECLVRVGLMPQGSRSADLMGTVRTFETALRTRYRPQNIYMDPVRLVLVDDPGKDKEANERSLESIEAGWKRWAPNLTVWRSPGNHMTMLRQPHIAVLSDWLLSTLPPTGALTATRAQTNE